MDPTEAISIQISVISSNLKSSELTLQSPKALKQHDFFKIVFL